MLFDDRPRFLTILTQPLTAAAASERQHQHCLQPHQDSVLVGEPPLGSLQQHRPSQVVIQQPLKLVVILEEGGAQRVQLLSCQVSAFTQIKGKSPLQTGGSSRFECRCV